MIRYLHLLLVSVMMKDLRSFTDAFSLVANPPRGSRVRQRSFRHGSVQQPQQETSESSSYTDKALESMRAGEIKKELEEYGISTKAFLEKKELIESRIPFF